MAKAKKASNQTKERTVFILYIPGGSMMGIIPAVMLRRLEELTETPAIELFQVVDGVSTGSIIAAGLNVRDPKNQTTGKLTPQNMIDLFCKHGPEFFPPVPHRFLKMFAANIFNKLADSTDPAKADALIIHEITKLCQDLRNNLPNDQKPMADDIRNLGTACWITKSYKNRAIRLAETIGKQNPEMAEITGNISELIYVRSTSTKLGKVFNKSALGSMKWIEKKWAKNYLYPTDKPVSVYREQFGENRLSDTLRSTYISTYDLRKNKVRTFYSRKKDLFSLNPYTPVETSKTNPKLWDAVVASTANPFAFPPHTTEDGILCTDKAIIHTPLPCIVDIMMNKPKDTTVKLVVLGTGHHLSPNKDQKTVREEYIRYGVVGNIMAGRELAELENYIMSMTRGVIRRTLGNDNIIEFSPRLSARTYKETKEFPDRNALNADPENIQKILKRAESYVADEDQRFRELAYMLVENLHTIGQIDDAKFKRVTKKIGVKPPANQNKTKASDQKIPKQDELNSFIRGAIDWLYGKTTKEQDNDKKNPPDRKNGTGGDSKPSP